MRDTTISIEARGLLALMMGMGDDWTYRMSDLMKRCQVGKDKYQRMIRELKAAGYLEVVPVKSDSGKMDGFDYVIHDEPACRENRQAVETPTGEQGDLRKPSSKKTNNKTPIPPEGDLIGDSGNQDQVKDQTDPIDEGFTQFWASWPSHKRKAGKVDCAKKYRKACEGTHPKADKIDPETLNRCAAAYVADLRREGKLDQFLKAPLAWLNQPGWEPFLETSTPTPLDVPHGCPPEIVARGANAIKIWKQYGIR
ncbi:helix-turn-helix domain-containing protein [Tropicibacter alexandrii]|uniref:helix-turn-helix domain-containing protein n=1 Tax=Tropicibacter alexandrii TaxID=2267683 RepID=UPI000EF556FB|nr:helix-turn-helix domain-containing protein [Tropicibacter alexandrii]